MRQGKTFFPFFCIGGNRWLSRLDIKKLRLTLKPLPCGFPSRAVSKRNGYHEVYTCLSLLHKDTSKILYFNLLRRTLRKVSSIYPPMQSSPKSSFVYFIREDGDLLFSIPITNIFKVQGTKFLSCYKRILECWVDLCARCPHSKEDRVRRRDSVATFPFMPLTPSVGNGLRTLGSSVRYP